MKKTLFLLLAFVVAQNMYAQTEKASYQTASQVFEQHYNAGTYDSVFQLFSPEMKAALPLEKTVQFLTSLKTQAGGIAKRQFTGYENGSYAVYKTTFERALFAVNISVDKEGKINGLFIKPFVEDTQPVPMRNITRLQLPFKDEWTVFWGGDTKEQNYHVEHKAQKNAFDMIITDEKGKSFKTTGASNEDYYAFGKELLAPCDGEIVSVVDGIHDNTPGQMNKLYVPGNTVVLKTANNEYLFFAHFKKHSIKVKEGQLVKQGQLLGLCGNSGNSSEAHLHFHIQHVADMNVATGIKCYFDKLNVNGKVVSDYSPVKSDKIRRE